MERIWNPRPLSLVIVETLYRKGPMPDVDLHKELKSSYGELSFRELNSELLKLEVNGLVRVTRLAKGKRRVEVVEKKESPE